MVKDERTSWLARFGGRVGAVGAIATIFGGVPARTGRISSSPAAARRRRDGTSSERSALRIFAGVLR